MPNFDEPQELKLTEIFTKDNYIIPIYQRSYAWEKDQIEQLINDIYDSKSEEKYYLGSLIVDKQDSELFSVIDGQQRLTTLFLLLTYLMPTVVSKSLCFESREKSNRTIEVYRYQRSLDNDKSLYSTEIIQGRQIIEKIFKEKIKKIDKYKENFIKKLANIVIIRTPVPPKIDLNHYFEIMNTRGEQLEIHEIAKGRLLGVIKDDVIRKKAGIVWDACAQMDKYVQMNFDVDSRKNIFSDDWNKFLPQNAEELFAKLQLKNNESNNNDSQTTSERDNYNKFSLLDILKSPNQTRYAESENKDDSNEEQESFESIVSFPNFLLILNEAKVGETENDDSLDDKKFIKSLEKYWNDSNGDEANDKACDFIFTMLKMRYLFDSYIVKREYAKDYKVDGKWALKKLERYEYKPKNSKANYPNTYKDNIEQNLRHLQAGLRITYTSPKTMHWISLALRALFNNEKCDLLLILEKYSCNKVKNADYKNAQGFGIDRIVFTYLDYILVRDQNKNDSFKDFHFQFRNSIEHFYPQHPDKSQSFNEWDDEYLNNFGNLALVTVKANSKFSNSIPKSKVADNPNTIKQSPKLILMEKVLKENNNNWTENLALQHGNDMKRLLEKEIESKLPNN